MRSAKIFTLSLIVIFLSTATFAQSGRKQKKAPELPPVQGVPAPSKTPEPPKSDLPEIDPEKEKEDEKKKASMRGIILGTDWADMNVSLNVSDYVRSACQDELRRQVRGLEVRPNGRMSRGDAVKIAKDEERFYTVLLEFSTMSQLEVRYTIFEPKTGKVLGIGSSWIPTDSYGRASYYGYERAGRDVARQILGRVDLHPLTSPASTPPANPKTPLVR